VRLAAIHSFFSYAVTQDAALAAQSQPSLPTWVRQWHETKLL